ncbi:helix-turn-helix transcriptional regulator [Myroides odoratimimus]|uniref:helix-turn-helix domain-containing protein n=1 Tax=Myroides odoratimimus TaxID=76832 RepID=UPI00310199B5
MSNSNLEVLNKNIGRIIRVTRLRKRESQLALGAEIGLSSNQVGRIERGIANPTVKTLLAICNYLSLDIEKLFVIQTEAEIKILEKEIIDLDRLMKRRTRK